VQVKTSDFILSTSWNLSALIKPRAEPRAGLEKTSGWLINNFSLNLAKPQNCKQQRLNRNPAGWQFKFG